jgi:endonuclease I
VIGAVLLGALPQTGIADAYSPPAGYYGSTTGLVGAGLDAALNARTLGHSVRTYDQIRADLAVTDRDWSFPPPASNPTAITRILLVYSYGWSGYSRSGVWDSGATWNREHTWPDSRGVGQPDDGLDFSDLHHLRAAEVSANSSRSNNWYDAGGTLAPVVSAPQARRTATAWEPPDVDKGWVARACLYMATRYNGTETNTTDLVLVETPPASVTSNPPQMGRKSTLLRWNRLYPPQEWERRRNQIIYDLYQHNRNPFIDYPEFADVIYEQAAGKETRATWRYRNFTLAELNSEAVSGDLADPDGDGAVNLLEYALASDPRRAEAATLPTMIVSTNSVTFEFQRQRDRDLDGMSYAVETTNNLASSWQALAGGVETVIATNGATESVRVTIPTPALPLFLRLRVTR